MTSQQDTLIEISGLKFSYPNLDVLKGLDLAVPRGKVIAILGASGCGKTTLLRLIGGQLRPAGGHVKVDGEIIHELDTNALYEMRRKMGMMFQQGGLFTDISTFENIAFPMRERTNLPEELIHDMVLMKLHSVGLRGAHGLMPSELSGGEQQRVAIARALATGNPILVADEPTGDLDFQTGVQVLEVLQQLARSGHTVIVVTHNREISRSADRVIELSSGRIVSDGPPLGGRADVADLNW